MDACTIVARRELARARVLAGSYLAHDPDAAFFVVVLDGVEGADAVEGATVLTAESLLGSGLGALAAGNTPAGLTAALVPHAIRHALQARVPQARSGAGETADPKPGPVVYLGAGLRVLGPLEELDVLAREHATVLVSRALPPPQAPISYGQPEGGGAVDHRVLACRQGPASEALLARWPSYFAGEGGQAVCDWFDSVPAIGEDVAVLREPGYGLDEWTLSAERVDGGGEPPLDGGDAGPLGGGELSVEGRPARLIDLGWLDPEEPLRASSAWKDARLDSIAALSALRRRHAEDLLAHGYEDDAKRGYRFEALQDGVPLNELMRRLWREGVEEGRLGVSPFEPQGRKDFYAYLSEPGQAGAEDGLTRLHLEIWRTRPDVQEAFPHLDGPDGLRFAVWLCEHARADHGVPDALLPWEAHERVSAQTPASGVREPLWGANVVGFFASERGLGEAARLLLAGLDARGVPALPVQARLVPAHREVEQIAASSPKDAPYPVNILCVNGELVGPFAREAGPEFFAGRHTIALWWWELGELPESWEPAFEHVDEVWVGSQHIYDAVAPRSPVPVVKMTMPVALPRVPSRSRAQLGLPEDGFLFLYVHDYHSTAARKNPVGVVEAFKRAFPPGAGAKLVVKSMNAESVIHEHDRVALAAAGHPDIALIDAYVPAEEKNAMIAACDCYVSLHRSEGFGLTAAEAMLLGKPVIATAYGGNLEFMNEQNSYLVGWRPAPVGPGAHPYPAEARWAEPDLDEAAALMREVVERPERAHTRAERGRREVSARHAPAVAGAQMEARMRLAYQRLVEEGLRAVELSYAALEADEGLRRLIAGEPALARGSGVLPAGRRALQRMVARLSQRFAARGRSIDARLYEELVRLQERMGRLADELSRRQEDRFGQALAAVRRLEAEVQDVKVALEGMERPELEARLAALDRLRDELERRRAER